MNLIADDDFIRFDVACATKLLIERAEIAVSQWGFDLSRAHPMAVPAKTVHYLCTCNNPMEYTGKVLVAADFVKERGLL